MSAVEDALPIAKDVQKLAAEAISLIVLRAVVSSFEEVRTVLLNAVGNQLTVKGAFSDGRVRGLNDAARVLSPTITAWRKCMTQLATEEELVSRLKELS